MPELEFISDIWEGTCSTTISTGIINNRIVNRRMEGKGCGQDRKEDILCIPSNCMSEMGPYLEMSVAKPDIVSDGHLR